MKLPVLWNRMVRRRGGVSWSGLLLLAGIVFLVLASAWRVDAFTPKRKPTPALPVIAFSATPKDQELYAKQILPMPLVPIHGDKVDGESRSLAQALLAFTKRAPLDDFSALTGFVQGHPSSRWNASLDANLGYLNFRAGYFSRALDSWKAAWELAKNETEPQAKQLADYAVTEYIGMNARVGRVEVIEPLMKSLEGRPMTGTPATNLTASKSAFWEMQHRPGTSFQCGVYAIRSLLASEKKKEALDPLLITYPSTPKGLSLQQVHDLAKKVKLDLQIVQRTGDADIVVPSIVHWKLNHYAAILAYENGAYLVKDPTFHSSFHLSRAAINAEASGYFLVPGKAVPAGYTAVGADVAKTVWGRGKFPTKSGEATTACGTPMAGSGDSSDSGVNSCSSCSNADQITGGPGDGAMAAMPKWNVHLMLASISLYDAPVGYTPPVGPQISFRVAYNQLEAMQPSLFNQSNLGSKWTYNWMSYVQDDPTAPSDAVTLVLPAGGGEFYNNPTLVTTGTTTVATFATQGHSRAVLVRTTTPTTVTYVRTLRDGSQQTFNLSNGVSGPGRFVYMTEMTDAVGRSVEIGYDSTYRITSITDAVGKTTTLSYGLSGDPLKITQVTDPYGRSATFTYDGSGRLASITDVAGMTSSFTYVTGTDDLATLVTPCGTTTFTTTVIGSDIERRIIDVVNAAGQKERFESIETSPILGTEPVPNGIDGGLPYLYYRNAFYWDPKAAVTYGTSDYSKAVLYHFYHTEDGGESGVLESTKKPFENRYYYNVLGANWITLDSNEDSLVTAEGRVLDDGSSQVIYRSYNDFGNLTQIFDPLGRETDYTYDTNGIDLLQVSKPSSVGTDYLFSATYNGQHQPLTVTDVAGQTTTFTYNGGSDLATITTPPTAAGPSGETTTFAYSSHLLQTITRPVSGAVTTFAYDSTDRVHTVTDSEGYTLTYSYDPLDRVTQVAYPDGTTYKRTYARLDLTSETDRLGRVTKYTSDSLGRRLTVLDPLHRLTQFEWCYCGALQKLIDPAGNATQWAYDIEGRMLSKTYADGSKTSYAYENTTRRLKTRTDALGQVTAYAYNVDDTVASVAYSGTVHATPNVTYAYDPYYVRLTSMTDGTGTTTYDYGVAGAVGANRLATVTGPLADSAVTYGYDSLGRPLGAAVNGTGETVAYDLLGRVTQAVNPLGTFAYAYLRQTGRPASLTYPNGQVTNYAYYGGTSSPVEPRLQQIQNLASDGTTVLSNFAYQYDAVGNITQWTQQQGGASVGDFAYGYDKANQLISATLGAAVTGIPTATSYIYDKAANRTGEQRDNLVMQASYNNLNQLTSRSGGGTIPLTGTVSKAANVAVNGKATSLNTNTVPPTYSYSLPVTVGTNNFTVTALDGSGNASTNHYQYVASGGTGGTSTYDVDGNLLSDGTRTYQWDAENRLIQIVQGGNTYQFAYDGLSRRISEADNGTLTKQWIWSGENLVEERDGSNAVTKRFYRGGEQIAGTAYFCDRDHLGSVRELTDGSGTVQARYQYDPYGRTTKTSGSLDADFQYAGYYAHIPTSLNLTCYRAYDADAGRWLSRDVLLNAEIRQGSNLYVYVGNNSTGWSDPLGLGATSLDTPAGVEAAATLAEGGMDVFGNTVGASPNVISDGQAAAAIGLALVADAAGGGSKPPGGGKTATGGSDCPDPDDLTGKTPEEIDAMMKAKGWNASPSNSGGGTRYANPDALGEQVRVQPGNANDPNPVKQGPYARVSSGGQKSAPIPLSGNPTLP